MIGPKDQLAFISELVAFSALQVAMLNRVLESLLVSIALGTSNELVMRRADIEHLERSPWVVAPSLCVWCVSTIVSVTSTTLIVEKDLMVVDAREFCAAIKASAFRSDEPVVVVASTMEALVPIVSPPESMVLVERGA